MAKYSVAKGQNKETILEINGTQSICPYTPAIPVPGSIGQIQIMRMPCTSNCPHASHNQDIWLITCSGKELKFKLETKEQEQLDSKIIELGHS